MFPGKGLLPAVPLSCLLGVTALLCHQLCSWELYDTQHVLRAARLLIGMTLSSLLIHRTLVPPGCGLDRCHFMQLQCNLINANTCISSGHVCKCNTKLNFIDEVRSVKTVKFYTLRKFILLWYVMPVHVVCIYVNVSAWALFCLHCCNDVHICIAGQSASFLLDIIACLL